MIHVDDQEKKASALAFHLPIQSSPDTNSNPPTVILRVLSIEPPGELLNVRFQNLTEFRFSSHSRVLENLGERLVEFLRGCPNLKIAKFDYYPGFKEYFQDEPVSLYNLQSFTQSLHYELSGVNPIGLLDQLLLSPTCNFLLMDEDDSLNLRPWNVSFPISHHFSQYSPIKRVEILVSHEPGSSRCMRPHFQTPTCGSPSKRWC